MIIGIAGPKGVGKTTVAKAIVKTVEGRVMSFADPIRDMMDALMMHTGIPNVADYLHRDKDRAIPQLQGRNMRYLMQTLGTEWGRVLVGTNLWTDLAAARARKYEGLVIFDDVRFPSEVAMIEREGGFIIGLKRSGIEYEMTHASEEPLTGVPYLTNSSPEEVAEVIANMI